MQLRVARLLPTTEAEGPGRRFALWVQGCAIRCPGCCNPELFEPRGGTALDARVVIDDLTRVAGEVEGVTFLGGEPFAQDVALAEVARAARALGLSVMTFTGHTRAEVTQSPLFAATDLLVDGRYDATQPETERRWVGSRNQRFHFLTERYAPGIERGTERTVEVRLSGATVEINGWPVRLRP